ncbi:MULTISPECIES: membrane-bound lytic murein transglycosylase MltF [Deefgea]|uniref:Membrane-bound lytic murein transglycosylase MltF n=1 Tax=Deefgea chitinilytica TaxID=570276 RepID=A0ABS2CF43_9NEIS|nr:MULTISPECIES: membrane-bound lytic murein transglycosylase MltF [Deefgea]MBM5572063.1 membrane-bound lytic murein transglycosylase MltF [Deefgea chitinilytica]MBM9889298.1 membrane-bound lytic murein transglycosylase MltF [Deefgea sp. CFH1-16]
MKKFLIALSACVLLGCGEHSSQFQRVLPWAESKELTVLVQNGPTTLYVDAEGRYAGLEYDLVTRFAELNNLNVRFIMVATYAEVVQRLKQNEAHLAVGVHRGVDGEGLLFGPAYQNVTPVLVYAASRSEADVLKEIQQGQAPLSTLPQYLDSLSQQKAQYPNLQMNVVAQADNEDLIEQVSSGQLAYAVVDSHAADVAQNYYPNVAISKSFANNTQQLSWAVRDEDPQLRTMASAYFRQVMAEGTLARLQDRYYGHVNRVDALDALTYLGRIKSTLPKFRAAFLQAEAETGIDWRLLAALAYQESHWDNESISPTGVRGIMMLTNDTASLLGVDRLNPRESILGGARYVQMMRNGIPETIPEPDRTWIALAAYNIGMGHVEDARTLALRLNRNPDSWTDLKGVLPLLRKPEHFSTLKYGYARGGAPVIYVERLKSYYDILVRFERPSKVTLPEFSNTVVVHNPGNLTLDINSKLNVIKPKRLASL